MSVDTVRILHFSNLLLDDPGHDIITEVEFVEKIREDKIKAFENILKVAKKEKVDCIISNGNLINDEYADLNTLNTVADLLSRYRFPMYIIAGKKDRLHPLSYYEILDFPSNIHIFPDKLEVIDLLSNVHLYGISISDGKDKIVIDEEKIDEKDINILILPDGVHADKASHFNGVLIPSDKWINSTKGLSYSLPPLPLGYNGNSGVTLMECGKDALSSKQIKVSDLEMKEVEIVLKKVSNAEELEKILTTVLNEKNKRTVLKLKITGTISPNFSPDWQRVKEKLKQHFYFISLETDIIPYYDIIDMKNANSIAGKYIREIAKMDDLEAILSSKGERRDALYMGLNLLREDSLL